MFKGRELDEVSPRLHSPLRYLDPIPISAPTFRAPCACPLRFCPSLSHAATPWWDHHITRSLSKMEIALRTAGGHNIWICSGRVYRIFYGGGSCAPAPCTSTSLSRGCSRHPPPTPSPILSRDLLQPWERSFPSAPGSLPAQREFGIFGENQEIGIWSFLLHSRNKNVASTKRNGACFFMAWAP